MSKISLKVTTVADFRTDRCHPEHEQVDRSAASLAGQLVFKLIADLFNPIRSILVAI